MPDCTLDSKSVSTPGWQPPDPLPQAPPLLLVSASPRRRELLARAGLRFTTANVDVREITPPGLAPGVAAEYVARLKSRAARHLWADNVLLTADTVVAVGSAVLGKPCDQEEAMTMLAQLTGRTHIVVTGVALFDGHRERVFHEVTEVTFARLDKSWAEAYVASGYAADKAGGYGIQDWLGLVGITAIRGDYYNVMGLPVARLIQELRALTSGQPGRRLAS